MRLAFRIVVVLALAGAAVAGFRYLTRPEPVAVKLATVEQGRVEATVANTRAGTVKACRRSGLAPAIGGQVARLAVHEGQRVAEGQVLIELWNDDRKAQVKLAAAEARAAEARAREACLTAEVAAREARRLEALAERNVVAEEQVDRASTEARAREAACRAAQAAHEVSRAQVDAARAALELTLLEAPFDGVVAEVNAEIGEYVTPSPPGIQTLPAIDLIDDSCLYVAAPIDEVDAPAIRAGMPACVSLDAFPEKRCGAHVRRVAPYVLDREKQARTVEVEVEFGDPAHAEGLLPGYTADVEIVLETRDGVLRVPTEAVLEGGRVLVYRPETGRLEERRLRTGLSNWRHTEVREGLRAGERVVVSVDRAGVEPGALAVPEPEAVGGG